jgi:alkylation response protein AidB-like acyl-CoA dehydrogenase
MDSIQAQVAQELAYLQRAQQAAPQLAEYAAWAEEHARLHPDACEILKQAGVGRLYLPGTLGGYEVSPVSCALICETLAAGDAAAAWHVMVFNAARLMAAHWPADLVETLWLENPDTLVAASGHTPFRGHAVAGGFVISGTNSFVSGVHHADYVMSPLVVDDALYTAIVPSDELEIVDNWDTLGMRGTGSNDVTVKDAFISEQLVVAMPQNGRAEKNRHYQGQLYRCPSRVVFATYIPVALSLAQRALDFLSDLAQNKVPYATEAKLRDRSIAQIHYGRGLAIYRSARGYFFDALAQVWDRAQHTAEFTDQQRAELYLAGTHTMQACAEVVRHVADAAGSSVLTRRGPFEQILRDMETLRHHGFANESRYASVTQVLWGAQLDYPLLLR